MSRYGWDTDALFYPSLDRDGLLVLVALILFTLHFGELFGINTATPPVLDIFPVPYAYQVGLAAVYVLFALVLYRWFPEADA